MEDLRSMKQDTPNPAVIHKRLCAAGLHIPGGQRKETLHSAVCTLSKQTPQVDGHCKALVCSLGAGIPRETTSGAGEPEPWLWEGQEDFSPHIRSGDRFRFLLASGIAPWSLGVVVEWQGCSGCSRGDSRVPVIKGRRDGLQGKWAEHQGITDLRCTASLGPR